MLRVVEPAELAVPIVERLLVGTDEVAKATAKAVSNTKLTPAAPGWANVESDKIMEDLFVNIAGGGDVTALAKAADDKITAALNR